jgi:hypothetical protein
MTGKAIIFAGLLAGYCPSSSQSLCNIPASIMRAKIIKSPLLLRPNPSRVQNVPQINTIYQFPAI